MAFGSFTSLFIIMCIQGCVLHTVVQIFQLIFLSNAYLVITKYLLINDYCTSIT